MLGSEEKWKTNVHLYTWFRGSSEGGCGVTRKDITGNGYVRGNLLGALIEEGKKKRNTYMVH